LIQAREVFDLVIAVVSVYAASECGQGQQRHELCEYKLALMHLSLRRKSAQTRKSGAND
jgi:hypothetical protein